MSLRTLAMICGYFHKNSSRCYFFESLFLYIGRTRFLYFCRKRRVWATRRSGPCWHRPVVLVLRPARLPLWPLWISWSFSDPLNTNQKSLSFVFINKKNETYKTSSKVPFYSKLSYLTALIAEMIQIKMNNPPKRTMKNIAAKSFANIAAMLHHFLQINCRFLIMGRCILTIGDWFI